MIYQKIIAIFLTFTIFAQGVFAATYTAKEALNLYAMGVTSTLATDSIRRLGFLPNSSNLSFSGGFGESGFWSSSTGIVGTNSVQLDYTGTLIGDFGDDIAIDISLSGHFGANDINGTSTMTWAYDIGAGGYQNAVLEEHGEINPVWFWVAAVILFSAITNVANAPAPADIQYNPAPNDPSTPIQGGEFDIGDDGDMSGSLNGSSTLDGVLNGSSASGSVSAIPEADTLLLALVGVFSVSTWAWRRNSRKTRFC